MNENIIHVYGDPSFVDHVPDVGKAAAQDSGLSE
jgi:hypothetical protein